MKRLHNFSAGPAALPTSVLQRAADEMLNWQEMGVSVMEISHRSADFVEIARKAEHNLRKLMNINDDYVVLFLQGGATLHFAGIALNLLQNKADYLITGAWSAKAYKEACSFGQVQLVADANGCNYTDAPAFNDWQIDENADYFHYCTNETIHGVYLDVADFGQKIKAPIVADMSSDILSRPININNFGLIYAGAQKNIGAAGLTLVIIRRDLLDRAAHHCPSVMNYSKQAAADSMLNTPNTYGWYLSGLVFEWLLEQGGVDNIYAQNLKKAELLYNTIDGSDFYQNKVNPKHRSIMNVPFLLADAAYEAQFLQQSKEAGLLYLKGHKSVGGLRASIYNAVSLEDVMALTDFMRDFENRCT